MESISSSHNCCSLDHDEFLSPTTIPSNSNVAKSYSQLSRSLSINSTHSVVSTETNSTGRESIGSVTSYSDNSFFQSSLSSFSSSNRNTRQSYSKWSERPLRRGYVRPQGTNFAESARSRESVLSLGSIAHLQYYFARTGLLDGKGGRRAKRKSSHNFLDNPALDSSFISVSATSDADSSYASMESNPESPIVKRGDASSVIDEEEFEFYSSESEDSHPHMLPPTVSTYNHREKYIPHPPTLGELKEELKKTLSNAEKSLAETGTDSPCTPSPSTQKSSFDEQGKKNYEENLGWYQIQGVHILDVMTLAIRAAKIYYTAHDRPARLATIKPEKQIRSDLLSVMEALRKMATRQFASGIKEEERSIMDQWLASTHEILRREEAIIEEERLECTNWVWLDDNWSGSSMDREWAFMKSMDPDSHTLPAFKSVDEVRDDELPTEFLKDLMTGLRLVKLHNAIVRRSKRPFGAIEKWHTDFGKTYRSTENLLFWIKAAELRFEVILNIDVTSIVHGANREAWKQFENAILIWCGSVRREISMEIET